MRKYLIAAWMLFASSLASTNTQNCKGGGMTFHISSRGIAVLGPVQVTMKNKEGTWRGSGNFSSYRTMTLRKVGGA